MSWAQSLIKLSAYEVEVLQKRLSEIAERRLQVEMKLVLLEAEGETEAMLMTEQGWYQAGFLEGLRLRKADGQRHLSLIALEETGARDALAQAFETQKKYEQVAEGQRLTERRDLARREAAALDEMGLRRQGRRG